jgi:hypothetical protein
MWYINKHRAFVVHAIFMWLRKRTIGRSFWTLSVSTRSTRAEELVTNLNDVAIPKNSSVRSLDLVALFLDFFARTASTAILNSCCQCLFWSSPSDFSWLFAINYSLWPPVIFGSLYMLQSFNNSFDYVKVVTGVSSVAIFSLNLYRKFLLSLSPSVTMSTDWIKRSEISQPYLQHTTPKAIYNT